MGKNDWLKKLVAAPLRCIGTNRGGWWKLRLPPRPSTMASHATCCVPNGYRDPSQSSDRPRSRSGARGHLTVNRGQKFRPARRGSIPPVGDRMHDEIVHAGGVCGLRQRHQMILMPMDTAIGNQTEKCSRRPRAWAKVSCRTACRPNSPLQSLY